MAPAGASRSRDVLAALPEPAFAALAGRHLWGAATRAADRVLKARPSDTTPADLDVLAEAHSYTKDPRYLTGALERIADSVPMGAAGIYRDAYLARAAASSSAVAVETADALIDRVAGSEIPSGGDAIEAACARLALAGHLGVGDVGAAGIELLAALRAVLDDEGAHRSGSPGPHAMVHGMLAAVLEAGLCDEPELLRLRDRMEEVLAWLVAPDGTLSEVGETPPLVIGGAWTGNASPGRMKAVYRHPALLHAATAGALGVAPGRGWRMIPGAGIAVVKRGWPDSVEGRGNSDHLVFLGPGAGRRQDDALSLTWFTGGRWILVDTGHLPVGIEPHRPDQEIGGRRIIRRVPDRVAFADHLRTAAAHNTLSFPEGPAPLDEGGFQRWGEIGGVPFLDAVAVGARGEHRRSVAMGSDWLVVIDRVEVGEGVASECRFHSPDDLDLAIRGEAYLLSTAGTPSAWVRHLGSEAGLLDPVRGSTRGRIAGWRVGPTGRPVPAWAYGWSHVGPFAAATLFTAVGPAVVRETGPGEYSWEAGGGRVSVRIDALGIADIEEGIS